MTERRSGNGEGTSSENHEGPAATGPEAEAPFESGLAEAAKATFWGHLGCELASVGAGRAEIRLAIRPFHLNMLGIVHGGVLASLLDNAMGLAVMRLVPAGKAVTAGLNIHYLQSADSGILTCEAEVVHRSRRTLTLKGSVIGSGGDLLAWGSGSFRLVT